MNALVFMIPCALALGAIGLAAFVWALRNGQFDDPAGASARMLQDHDRPD